MGMNLNQKISNHVFAAFMSATLIGLSSTQPVWSAITITVVDGKSNPIPGVSCGQNGGQPAVSDQAGKLTLTDVTSIFQPQQRAEGGFMLSRIPLSGGEKATVTVTDTRGKNVMRRVISLGERAEFSRNDKGVYFVNISSRNYSTRGRFVNLGGGMVFEGLESKAKVAAAAKTAAGDAAITCSKAGYSTQVYRIADGSSPTIDFSKVNLVPLFDNSTELEPAVVVETSDAIITRWADRARDRHAREDQFHLYDHYLAHYWEHRTMQVEIIDYVAKGGNKIVFNMTSEGCSLDIM